LHIAFLGIRGVPARYSGFETAAEEVGRRLVEKGHDVTVYCRGRSTVREHLGMQLVHLPTLRLKVTDTLVHTAFSILHMQARPPDAAVVFNAANAPLLPIARLRGVPVAVHVDGLEWMRAKWGPLGKRYYRMAERLAVRWADVLIADARAIEAYYLRTHGAASTFIPYGAPILADARPDLLAPLGLKSREFHLIVARFEPENHVDVMIRGYAMSGSDLPLVVVGSAPYNARYTAEIRQLAGSDGRVRLLGGVWDQDLVNALYANAYCYLHGHSVGGTNPTLLRAMGAGAPVLAFDVPFNREVLGDTGLYFETPEALAALVDAEEADPPKCLARGRAGQARAAELYDWDAVAADYEQLCEAMAATAGSATPR
jgi:glycosyltransferase involved in cell wall biosynthesis